MIITLHPWPIYAGLALLILWGLWTAFVGTPLQARRERQRAHRLRPFVEAATRLRAELTASDLDHAACLAKAHAELAPWEGLDNPDIVAAVRAFYRGGRWWADFLYKYDGRA